MSDKDPIDTISKDDPNVPKSYNFGTPGRKPGQTNLVTREAKRALQLAYDECGGADGFAKWAKENPNRFYPMYMRLLFSSAQSKKLFGESTGLKIVINGGKEVDIVRPNVMDGDYSEVNND